MGKGNRPVVNPVPVVVVTVIGFVASPRTSHSAIGDQRRPVALEGARHAMREDREGSRRAEVKVDYYHTHEERSSSPHHHRDHRNGNHYRYTRKLHRERKQVRQARSRIRGKAATCSRTSHVAL